jgi:hypothetical protein
MPYLEQCLHAEVRLLCNQFSLNLGSVLKHFVEAISRLTVSHFRRLTDSFMLFITASGWPIIVCAC